ncbi:hypothetical protein HDF23_003763 [Mucilaginibacter lappiensis]|uniref:Uncharacterized protein n=1 Tax=Mucilaginibacter lappiensis TaxID=354630 RepID=A0ABR6PMJ3_9SPHI|nr:hypothetical protein [Mucilaginibacter lappiensis]
MKTEKHGGRQVFKKWAPEKLIFGQGEKKESIFDGSKF